MAKRILVIDDSQSVRQQVRLPLVDAGYDVSEASSGATGFDQIRKYPQTALLLCDVNMPGMSGIEFVEALRERNPTLVAPIVMLTTETRTALIQRAKLSGVKGWIVKPFKVPMLLEAVRQLVGDP